MVSHKGGTLKNRISALIKELPDPHLPSLFHNMRTEKNCPPPPRNRSSIDTDPADVSISIFLGPRTVKNTFLLLEGAQSVAVSCLY